MFVKLVNNFKMLLGDKTTDRTTKLLEAASRDTNACVVCANSTDARYLKSVIKENNWSIEVMTFNQFVDKQFLNTDIKSFYFNDVDKMFRGIAYPKKIKMMSANTDNILVL